MTTTKVKPKLIQNIDGENVILWFDKPNKYVVSTEINSKIIQLYTNPDYDRDSFVSYISSSLELQLHQANAIYDDVSEFLKTIQDTAESKAEKKLPTKPNNWLTHSYHFYNTTVLIRYESEIIKSLIHPQIAHHLDDSNATADVVFEIYKSSDDLYLLKDNSYVGTYKTESFHLLQGRFALELTNSIHNNDINKWVATFHASTITNGKESIMIIGDSGNGKSTLSVILMSQGYDILCDDFTPLYEEDNKLYRYPAATSVKKGAFSILKSYITNIDELDTLMNGPKKVNIKYVPPLQNYSNQKSSFPCNTIVYVKYNRDKNNSFSKVSKSKILETLIPDSWISPKETHAVQFINWLKEVNCFELNYNNNDFAISKFDSLLKTP